MRDDESGRETEKRMTENEQLLEQVRQAAARGQFRKAVSGGGPIYTSNKTQEQEDEEARAFLDELRKEER